MLLFDETSSTLDPTMVGEVLVVTRMLVRRDMSMLIVTHEMNLAREVANRVLFLVRVVNFVVLCGLVGMRLIRVCCFFGCAQKNRLFFLSCITGVQFFISIYKELWCRADLTGLNPNPFFTGGKIMMKRLMLLVMILMLRSAVFAESEDMVSTSLGRPAHSLVDKVPDETALVIGILSDEVPILLEITHRITHRMGIFTLDKRSGRIVRQIIDAPIGSCVHRTHDVCVPVVHSPLVLDRP